MKKNAAQIRYPLSVFGLLLLGLSLASAELPREPEPSSCLSEATIEMMATPNRVMYGESSVISWSVALPGPCPNVEVRLSGKPVPRIGQHVVTPPGLATVRILVSETHLGVYGERSASATVRVTYQDRVVIHSGTASPVTVLRGALAETANPYQTVELCVDLDLTGHKWIPIDSHRALIASSGCARGPRRFGPRILVTDPRGKDALFLIRGDNVRFSGFRLEGPTSLIGQGDRLERGIVIIPESSPEPIHNIEISNMEIFHWSGAGVDVRDNVEMEERGRLLNSNERAVLIQGNFFHHNRHGSGDGYGVSVGEGAYALIEQNVFDENRHAIAGGTSRHPDALDYSGYTARDNLILAGGGLHCPENIALPCWQTHQIDMHGDQNDWYSSHNWQCGTAGETIIIQRNTILYTAGKAIKIRGNPADKALADGNVFRHESQDDAIAQNGACGEDPINRIDVRANNQFGVDPMAQLGSCDFAGDGKLDQFMATGATWWAKSPVTQQWRYLNTMKERLPQLQLGRVDADAVCDVAPRQPLPYMIPPIYSKGGTTPWRDTLVIAQ